MHNYTKNMCMDLHYIYMANYIRQNRLSVRNCLWDSLCKKQKQRHAPEFVLVNLIYVVRVLTATCLSVRSFLIWSISLRKEIWTWLLWVYLAYIFSRKSSIHIRKKIFEDQDRSLTWEGRENRIYDFTSDHIYD